MAVKTKWFGEQFTRSLFKYVDKRMAKTAKKTERNIKARTPVETRALRASIKVSRRGLMDYIVASDKSYAIAVEDVELLGKKITGIRY